jgi:hypothetical protein
MRQQPAMIRKCVTVFLALVLLAVIADPDSADAAKKKRKKRSPITVTQPEKPENGEKDQPIKPAPAAAEPQVQGPVPPPTLQTTPQAESKATVAADVPAQADENREKEAEEAQRLMELFLRNQSVFIRKGELMAEMNTFYNRNSRQEFQPFPGGVALVKTTTRFIDTTLILRYGLLTDGLELDVIAPVFVHAQQKSDFGVAETQQTRDSFGDLGGALRYEVWYEQGMRPTLVLDVSGKSRTGGTGLTGTGTWNMGGGVTLLKTIDPVVFFGRLGYIYNFASQTRDLGNIFEYRLGMGFSLNDRVSFNMQVSGAYIGPSKVVGQGFGDLSGLLTPTQVTGKRIELLNLVFTTTIVVTKRFSIEPLIGVPLTSESFTMLGIRIPYRF